MITNEDVHSFFIGHLSFFFCGVQIPVFGPFVCWIVFFLLSYCCWFIAFPCQFFIIVCWKCVRGPGGTRDSFGEQWRLPGSEGEVGFPRQEENSTQRGQFMQTVFAGGPSCKHNWKKVKEERSPLLPQLFSGKLDLFLDLTFLFLKTSFLVLF